LDQEYTEIIERKALIEERKIQMENLLLEKEKEKQKEMLLRQQQEQEQEKARMIEATKKRGISFFLSFFLSFFFLL